jgi:branched-chain amino acid transport system ATP-binding protein
MNSSSPLLQALHLNTFYGSSHILFDVSLRIHSGECVSLLGRNGAGKTTTFRSIMGLTPPRNGSILLDGQAIDGLAPYHIARRGLGFVPEERAIFPSLSVWENLDVARKPAADGSTQWTLARIYEVFPRLAERRNQAGGTLSGGEQQMLTIARTLMGNPAVLLLDEPSEGLAPVIVELIGELIARLKREGVTVLMAEQNLPFSLALADRVYIIDDGRVQFGGTPAELRTQPSIIERYLGV